MNSATAIAIPTGVISDPIFALSRNLDTRTTSNTVPTVFVVEEDIRIRQSLEVLIYSQGWHPQICDSAREFLTRPLPCVPSAMILAFSSMGSNGLEVQKKIARECAEMPIIVIADYGDIPTTVQAMKAGAADFLMKPFRDNQLLDAVREALERSRLVLARKAEKQALQRCYASLSPRERQVMTLVSSGLLNKQVGAELGISEITVKAHRGQVMQKMQADSFADLIKMATKLAIPRRKELPRIHRDDSATDLTGVLLDAYHAGNGPISEFSDLRLTKMPLNNGSISISAPGFGARIPGAVETISVVKGTLAAGFRHLD